MPKRRPKTMPAATARTVSSATGSARGAAALMNGADGIRAQGADDGLVAALAPSAGQPACAPPLRPAPIAYPSRMAHNLRRDLGLVESYAALLGMLIGAGIFKVTGVAWELTGSSVILGYLVLAPAILATSVAYSVFLSTPLGREPGGEYTHLSRTFGGYGLAFVGVWLKVISYIGALAYLARALADYLIELLGGALPKSAAIPLAAAS